MKNSLTKLPATIALGLLSLGVLATTANASTAVSNMVGDIVWNDLNRDGIQNDGEPGISGVVVEMTFASGSKASTTTDANGLYQFINVGTGTFTVTVQTPNGFLASPTLVGADPAVDSNVSGSTVTLSRGKLIDTTIDFGFFAPTGAIGNYVWHDLNQNGVQDSDEPGIGGVTVNLEDAANPGTVLMTTVTSNTGAYLFTDVPAGITYKVTVDTASTSLTGFVPTVGTASSNSGETSPQTVVIPAEGAEILTANFGFFLPSPGKIGNLVWFDRNGNGIQDSASSEPGIAGVTVELFDLNKPDSPKLAQQITDSQGFYVFEGLLPGNYSVVVNDTALVDAGYLPTLSQAPGVGTDLDSNDNPSDVSLVLSPSTTLGGLATTSSDTTVDFGYYRLSSLSGYVFLDNNNDGLIQEGDVAIPQVPVTLTGVDINGNPVNLMTMTDANGRYVFENLQASNAAGYTITESQPDGYLDGIDTIGTPGGVTADDVFSGVVLGFGVDGENNNFAELAEEEQGPTVAFLSGFVYVDANNDGIKQATELPIAGVTVTVTGTDMNGTPVNATATTDATGLYTFLLVPSNASGYTVTESQPAGYSDGKDTIGTQGGTTSNDAFSNVVLTPGTNGVDNNFGERQVCCPVGCGDTATIGYWQNKNGQALINAVNGGCNSTAFANWLATSYPYLYGVNAGANNLTGKTNKAVAAKFVSFFKSCGTKTEAQMMAVAIATYVTNSTLAGGNYAAKYGFKVSLTGTGAKCYNVGCYGTAIGLKNNTSYTVAQLLQQANIKKQQKCFNSCAFNSIFDGINRKGDIR